MSRYDAKPWLGRCDERMRDAPPAPGTSLPAAFRRSVEAAPGPMYRDRELAHVLSDAGVRAIVCSQSEWNPYISGVAASSEVRIALTTSQLDGGSVHGCPGDDATPRPTSRYAYCPSGTVRGLAGQAR
ncbi:hypothetical protein SAMN05421504_101250 [Amycolatopsis xylanica]|uniref:Uncharacterized protein n=1 Tax=Amycolatopsis xylanica TaxID=589385 RepID=A0A1H2SJZ6_9PSEU|nr:hypothetical protein SAMN05421504_101250 [Amycolatopsis xylanica]